VVVELGTGSGYSTAWMLLALEEVGTGHIWSCDLVPSDSPIWQQINLPTTKLTYFSNDPVESLENKLPNEFDLVFHDAGHGLAEVQKDLAWVLPRLKVGSRLVIHDLKHAEGMAAWVLERFQNDPEHFDLEQIEEGCGVAIISCIKKLESKDPCKDELSGSTTQKAMDSSKVQTEKIISRTSQRSKTNKAGRRLRKTKTLFSSRQSKQKVQELKRSLPNG
jgi:hypothetical protein